jgi:predicted transcriptional regulator
MSKTTESSSDLAIARRAVLRPIEEIAQGLGIPARFCRKSANGAARQTDIGDRDQPDSGR